ncbi:MAG: hypothetical protein C0154_11140 [Mucilaginibacter sp.]|nr:MAG: hypothetical protein BGO48_03605 [Mucilaginibacter sp. 44-25]PAW95279.1 hypothetical protein CKK33_17945 [Mucilaginibacter sp. MD40]PLW89522.1 MAG: hypothetical protein C0154_11140 [Mucilaginibacter sp.]
MLSTTFQVFLIVLGALIMFSTIAFAVYCRQRAKAFMGTGRITDIESWAMRSNISLVFCAVLTTILLLTYAAA